VRDAPRYIALYLLLGLAWVGLSTMFMPLLGISLRDDVVERRNRTAAGVLAGAALGVTFCYAGGNIGNGPGWWVVVFSAALATGALFLLWYLLDAYAHISDTIGIDRDAAAGMRMAAWLIATGIVLGRAVAGDWVSAAETVKDFVVLGWPALGLLGAGVIIERLFRPTAQEPAGSFIMRGVLPAVAYIGLAFAWVNALWPPA
jgi:hypothetical protein